MGVREEFFQSLLYLV